MMVEQVCAVQFTQYVAAPAKCAIAAQNRWLHFLFVPLLPAVSTTSLLYEDGTLCR
jgi:hypothetical protein